LRKNIVRSNKVRVFRSDSEELAILRIPWSLSDKHLGKPSPRQYALVYHHTFSMTRSPVNVIIDALYYDVRTFWHSLRHPDLPLN
jgi:hypothetical protein